MQNGKTARHLGDYLRRARERRGITQGELARALHREFGDSLTNTAICQYEADSRQMSGTRLLRISKVLGCDLGRIPRRLLAA